MAVYKPTYCYPYLEPVDLTIPDGEKYFTCQIDTSNIAITGYKIEVYDENNTMVFPHESNRNKISPVSELPIVTNIDGLNGSELCIPFIQHFKPKITTSYNAVYFKATKYVDYYQSTPLVPGDGHSFAIGYNGQFCELIKTDPETGVRTLEPVVVDDSLIFVGDTILAPGANDTICIYTVTTEGLSEGVKLTNNDIIYVKSGDMYTGSVFQYNGGALIQSTDGVWVDCNENPLSLSNQGKTYKWQITLYSGSKGAITESKIIDPQEPPLHTISYDEMADSEFDTLLTSGTILGSTEDRIQGPISDKIYAKQWLQLLREVHGEMWAAQKWKWLTDLDRERIWTDGINIYYSNKTEQYQLDKSNSTWTSKTWKGLTIFDGQFVWADGDNIYYSFGEKQYQLDKTNSTWSEKIWEGLKDFYSWNVWTDGTNIYYSAEVATADGEGQQSFQYQLDKSTSTWYGKTWNISPDGANIWTDGTNVYCSSGRFHYQLDKNSLEWSSKEWPELTVLFASNFWTDGTNTYYSSGTSQYQLDKSNSTWSEKSWTGLIDFDGQYIWTDGKNIYYSNGYVQYQLDKSTSTWSEKIWNKGAPEGAEIWTDGQHIYYSQGSLHYQLNKNTLTWTSKTWKGLTIFDGQFVWTDGENIYYSNGYVQYQLDKSISTWSEKIWKGLKDFDGRYIWTDGTNIYYSCPTQDTQGQYQLDKLNSNWSEKTWNGLTAFDGQFVWADGENIYYSNGVKQYRLGKSTSTWYGKTWNGLTDFDGRYVWTDKENIYYSNGVNQYQLNKLTSMWKQKPWPGLTDANGQYVWTDGENIYYSSSTSQHQLLPRLLAQTGTRTYIESYSQSLGHIYPISGDSRGFSNDDLYGKEPATHFAVYKYSNDPEHMTSQNSVDQSINFELTASGATYTDKNYSYEVEGQKKIAEFNAKCKKLNTTPLCNYKHDEKQDSYTADYSGQSVLIWNERNSKANPLTGYFTINFTTSSGVDGENTPKFTFLMAYAYRKVSSYIGKVFFVKDGSFTNQNIVSKAEATGDNNILSLDAPLTFAEEEPLEIYPNSEIDKFHGEIFKNSAGKVYVSPFVGLQAGARLYVSDGTIIKATDVDATNWAVTYNPEPPASTAPYSSIDPLKYEIRTNFKSSDETPFYAYDSPRLVPWVLENLAVANEHGHEFLLESGGEILTVPILCSQKVDRRYIEVGGQYLQAQNKSWTSYRWLLVDAYGNIIQDTGKQYDGAIRTTFYGLDGPTSKAVNQHQAIPNVYYIVLIVEDELGNILLMGIKIEVTIDPTDLIAQFSGEFDCKTHSVKLGIQDYGYPALSKDENNQAIKLSTADGVVTAPPYVGLQGVDEVNATGNLVPTPSWKAASKMALPLEGAQLKRFFKYKANQITDITQTPSKMVANKEGNIEFHTQVELDANFCGDIFTYVVDIGDHFGNTDKLRISLALPENFLTSQGGDKV